MTPSEYLTFLKETHRQEEAITQQRNGDYSASDDCFSNFRRYGEMQFLSRMYEKFCRIENIIKTGKVNSVDDRFEDACIDLANYCHLLLGFVQEKTMAKKGKKGGKKY